MVIHPDLGKIYELFQEETYAGSHFHFKWHIGIRMFSDFLHLFQVTKSLEKCHPLIFELPYHLLYLLIKWHTATGPTMETWTLRFPVFNRNTGTQIARNLQKLAVETTEMAYNWWFLWDTLNSFHWLVVYLPLWKKWWSSSVGTTLFPTEWTVI